MNENRAQALERLLGELDCFDFFSPPYESDQQLIDAAASVLQPFLQNPERHTRHVAVVLEYVLLIGITRAFEPLLKLYNLPFAKTWLERRITSPILQRLKSRIQGARDEVMAIVDPGELKIDLLPIASVTTKIDWKKQGRRLVLIELRGAVLPATGMQLRAISQQLQVVSPVGSQFVDAIPSNEMETLGEREVSISERGKFVFSTTEDDKLAASLSGGAAKLQASVGNKDTSTSEEERNTAEKLSLTPQIARVISSAVGDTATWQLLRTPSQLLLGTNKFSATALIPSEATALNLVVRFGADIESWGPTWVQRSFEVAIPAAEG